MPPAFLPLLIAVVPPHHRNAVLHVDLLDDALQEPSANRLTCCDRSLTRADRTGDAPQPRVLLFDGLALHAQGIWPIHGRAIEDALHLLQRKPQEFERHDLFQALHVGFGVDAVARLSTRRLEQPEAIIVMEGLYGDASQCGEFLDVVALGQLVARKPSSPLT